MKDLFLKLAGVNSESAFYRKYPTEQDFFKAYPNAKAMKCADGGMMNKGGIPIQAESYGGQPEQVVLPDGQIESVSANTNHENMGEDDVTDVLPQGSHIQSARNTLKPQQYASLMKMFAPETADKDMEKLEQVYKAKYGKKKNKDISPADITEYAKKSYQKEPTPNSFNTEKLVEGNKKSFVDLGITMNDLIKAGKSAASNGMQNGGRVNKYAEGTNPNGVSYYNQPTDEYGNPIGYYSQANIPQSVNPLVDEGVSNWVNPIANDYNYLKDKGYLTYDPKIGKMRANLPSNMPYGEKIKYAQAIEQMNIGNVRQSKTKGYNNFYGGITPSDFSRYYVEQATGKKYQGNVDEKTALKDYFNLIGFKVDEKALANPDKIFQMPGYKQAYEAYSRNTPNMRPILGQDTYYGFEHLKAPTPNQTQPSVIGQTPLAKEEPFVGKKIGDLGDYSINGTIPEQQAPKSRYYSGLLERQLGMGLDANNAELNAYLSNTPMYQMETPDTYIRSRKTEVPIGNILYNIEKAQRNSANALANQTGDWSTLAGNIANAGATAMNQVGTTLSALNEKNVNLYNDQQALEQGLLEGNMGVRNNNLYNSQKLLNEKRNLVGQKSVKDAEMYSNYVKSLSENQQKEQSDKLALMSYMGAYPELFKGGQGQQVANRILGTYGGYNNPYAGTLLDYLTNR